MTDKNPSSSALSEPLFRTIWIAAVFSQIGVWVQDIGANWVMTELTKSPLTISMLQVALALPTFIVALPAGVLTDLLSKRKILLITSLWMLIIAIVLSILTHFSLLNEWIILGLIFLYGLGNSFYNPAWQATVPDIVSEKNLISAIALNSASINIARAVGPAIGGLLISLTGPAATMIFNALSFVGLMYIIFRWKEEKHESNLPKEHFFEALKVGVRFVSNSTDFKIVLLRTGVFLFFGSALWALLPYVLRAKLGYGSHEFGISMGVIGAGALLTSFSLIKLRSTLGVEKALALGKILMSLSLLGLALITNLQYMLVNLFFAGAGWITVISGLHTSSITVLPKWIRGRALSLYNLVFFGSMALGSFLWGFLAEKISSDQTLILASGGMFLSILLGFKYVLPLGTKDLDPSKHWHDPHDNFSFSEDIKGKVKIEIHYEVKEENHKEFLKLIFQMKPIRRSQGGFNWDIFQHGESTNNFIEVFHIESWEQHLHQHHRFTKDDRLLEEKIHKLHIGEDRPKVSHYISGQYRSIK